MPLVAAVLVTHHRECLAPSYIQSLAATSSVAGSPPVAHIYDHVRRINFATCNLQPSPPHPPPATTTSFHNHHPPPPSPMLSFLSFQTPITFFSFILQPISNIHITQAHHHTCTHIPSSSSSCCCCAAPYPSLLLSPPPPPSSARKHDPAKTHHPHLQQIPPPPPPSPPTMPMYISAVTVVVRTLSYQRPISSRAPPQAKRAPRAHPPSSKIHVHSFARSSPHVTLFSSEVARHTNPRKKRPASLSTHSNACPNRPPQLLPTTTCVRSPFATRARHTRPISSCPAFLHHGAPPIAI